MNLVFVQSLIRDRFLHLLLIVGVVLSFLFRLPLQAGYTPLTGIRLSPLAG